MPIAIGRDSRQANVEHVLSVSLARGPIGLGRRAG